MRTNPNGAYFDGKHGGSVKRILISSDKQKRVSDGKDGTLNVWDIHTGNQERLINSPRPNEIILIFFHNKIYNK